MIYFVKFHFILMNKVKNVNQYHNIDLYKAAFISACNPSLNMVSEYTSGNISFIFPLNHKDFQHWEEDWCDTRCSGLSSDAVRLTADVWSWLLCLSLTLTHGQRDERRKQKKLFSVRMRSQFVCYGTFHHCGGGIIKLRTALLPYVHTVLIEKTTDHMTTVLNTQSLTLNILNTEVAEQKIAHINHFVD